LVTLLALPLLGVGECQSHEDENASEDHGETNDVTDVGSDDGRAVEEQELPKQSAVPLLEPNGLGLDEPAEGRYDDADDEPAILRVQAA
jgi:hypothetical protein